MATDPTNHPVRGVPDEADRARKVLRAALASIEEAVLFVRAQGREIVGCNKAAEALFGYDCDELLGSSTEMLHTSRERFEEFGRIGEAVLARRETFRTDWEMRRKDGRVFPSSHTVSLVDEKLGLEGGAVSIIRRRSDVDSAAAELRELEERYKVLFDESPEPMCVYDLESSRLLAVNSVLAELYGGRPEDLRGRPLVELLVEPDRRDALEIFGRPDPGGRRSGTWRARRADGSVRVLSTSSNPVRFDGRQARLVVANDVTERLEAEARARRLLNILDATPDLVGIADRDERVQYMNPAGLRMLGEEDVDVTATTISDHMTADSMKLLRAEAIPRAAQEGSWSGETRLRHRDGTEIPVSQVGVHHRDEADGEEYLSTIARDLRQHQHLEDQLRQAQKMEAIGQLAGGIAHDFNNILTSILGYTELARLQADDPDSVRRHLGEVLAGARRASDLTSQLLAFGRRQTLEPRIVDLDRMVSDTEGMLRRMIEEKVQIRIRLSGGGARVEVDPSQMQQVLLNLVVNARDAMPTGGTLGIETDVVTLDRPRRTEGATVQPGGFAVLRVSDTGIGMDRDVLERIFEPFFTTKEADRGTGLGLSTVYGIVRQSGGFVEVESEPGRGSTFAVHLPRSTAEPEAEVASRPVEEEALRATGAVLLVEDDEALRRFLQEILETAGYDVLTASGADEALRRHGSARAEIDLLITDVGLPGMDGKELAERVRSVEPRLPILLISGYSYPAVGSGGLPASMRLLQKPFTAQELLDAVREVVESSSG